MQFQSKIQTKFRHSFTKFCNQTNSRVLISNMTILFSNCIPKIPKQEISGAKLRHFCFFSKFCNQTNSRVFISNMTIFTFKFQPKNTKTLQFQSKIQTKFRHSFTKVCNQTNSRVLISDMTVLFSTSSPKKPNQAFWVPNLRIFNFAPNFATRQVGGR